MTEVELRTQVGVPTMWTGDLVTLSYDPALAEPFVVFSVYAGLLQVPEETLEAAELDGAGAWQRLRWGSISDGRD